MPVNDKAQNRLGNESSPYLRQHAGNPVDWYPWGTGALKRAQETGRPLFISIGYSTCHWCHVMNRESFQDPQVAQVLNQEFIPVKVDREERPDVDQIYMTACQAMTGHGGWPLTVIATPEGKPFFAGTYFPPRPKGGLPGLLDILARVKQLWDTDRDRLMGTAEELLDIIQTHFGAERVADIPSDLPSRALKEMTESFDSTWGGFGSAPKFPTPHRLLFLLRHHWRTGDSRARLMAEKTLEAMYRGGMYDHVGFGFCRYSTDEKWLIPHFEKMLYDNALLALVYAEGAQVTGRDDFARISREIITYILRDMSSPEGGFYSAEDAESEGVEGKFYLWTPGEIQETLGQDRGRRFSQYYGIQAQGQMGEYSVPSRLGRSLEEVARKEQMEPEALAWELEESRKEVFEARNLRRRPFKDDKILTSWNALAVAALARAGRLLGQGSWVERAQEGAEFLDSHLAREEGLLWARYREGKAGIEGYADDYAFLAWAHLELFQSTRQARYLRRAMELTQTLMERFFDPSRGLAMVAGEEEDLIARPRELGDGALPSANSVAAVNLSVLARLTGSSRLERWRDELLRSVAGEVDRLPGAHAFYLLALEHELSPPVQVVVTGSGGRARDLLRVLDEGYLPWASVIHLPPGPGEDEITELVGWIGELGLDRESPAAHLCENRACRLPISEPRELARALEEMGRKDRE